MYVENKILFSRRRFLFLFIIIFFLLVPSVHSQTDWERWGKADISYVIKKAKYEDETRVEKPGFAAGALSVLRGVYAFLISDHDGDNCPFYPSCSNFYVQAVKEEGAVKGTLMFADRFTRDLNIFKSPSHYPLHTSGRFYDPPWNYTLTDDKIIYYTSESTVKK